MRFRLLICLGLFFASFLEACPCYERSRYCFRCDAGLLWYTMHGGLSSPGGGISAPNGRDFTSCRQACDPAKALIVFDHAVFDAIENEKAFISEKAQKSLGLQPSGIRWYHLIDALTREELYYYGDYLDRLNQLSQLVLGALQTTIDDNMNEAKTQEKMLAKNRKSYSEKQILEKGQYIAYRRQVAEEYREHYRAAERLLDESSLRIWELFCRIHINCAKKHRNIRTRYESGLHFLLKGEMESFIDNTEELLATSKKNQLEELLAEVHVNLGEALFEVGLYHEAILALNEAITKDPTHKEAYFQRAQAYFETGQFDLALSDYLDSGYSPKEVDLNLWNFDEHLSFHLGWIEGGSRGLQEGLVDFFPSLFASAYGLGHGMWSCVTEPMGVYQELKNAAVRLIEYAIDEGIHKKWIAELKDGAEQWISLSPREKGEKIGYIVGKYGIDILACEGAVKAVNWFRELKRANTLYTFESLRTSSEIGEVSKVWRAQKELLPKEFKINWSKQHKHTPGHPYYENRLKNGFAGSQFIHEHPESLLHRYAGSGMRKRGKIIGEAGYKEIVDFREPIGFWISENGAEAVSTTRGTIHYAKDGQAHIVPARPK